jgi:Ner family transcriptional regulator
MSSHRIPKKPEHRREWIKYQLKLVGSSFAAIAEEHRVSRQAVQLVNRQRSPKWEAVIAGKIGKTPEQIWPERYAA